MYCRCKFASNRGFFESVWRSSVFFSAECCFDDCSLEQLRVVWLLESPRLAMIAHAYVSLTSLQTVSISSGFKLSIFCSIFLTFLVVCSSACVDIINFARARFAWGFRRVASSLSSGIGRHFEPIIHINPWIFHIFFLSSGFAVLFWSQHGLRWDMVFVWLVGTMIFAYSQTTGFNSVKMVLSGHAWHLIVMRRALDWWFLQWPRPSGWSTLGTVRPLFFCQPSGGGVWGIRCDQRTSNRHGFERGCEAWSCCGHWAHDCWSCCKAQCERFRRKLLLVPLCSCQANPRFSSKR